MDPPPARPRFPFSTSSNELPADSDSEDTSVTSPPRGAPMIQNLRKVLRAPPLVHTWEFWHDRQDRPKASSSARENEKEGEDGEGGYASRLIKLHTVSDVRGFWELFNNFPVSKLALRDTIHLFHLGVKPVWEDPRNVRGGAWTFRVKKDGESGHEFWKSVAMLAIGEQLQSAVESDRVAFRDDICGISLSVRFTSYLITIWNRDGDHTPGIAKILQTVLREVPKELQPKESNYYYKKHADHAGFKGPRSNEENPEIPSSSTLSQATPTTAGSMGSISSSVGDNGS